MRTLLSALLFGTSLFAQSPSFFIDNSNGASPSPALPPLPPTYQFADTPAGSSSSVILRAANLSTSSIYVGTISVADASGSTTPNFTVPFVAAKVLPPSMFEDFTVNFTPSSAQPFSAVLRVSYEVQQNGCVLGSSDPAARCPETVADVSTFQGNGTPPRFVLTCAGIDPQCNG